MQKDKFLRQCKRYGVDFLYYLTHIDNLPGILKQGILPLHEIRKRKIRHFDISDPDVQDHREKKPIDINNGDYYMMHDLVPLFLRTKTPMLFSRKEMENDLCFIAVSASLLVKKDINCVICDGNAACKETKYFGIYEEQFDLGRLPWDVLDAEYWDDYPDGKRKRGAEFLVWPRIMPIEFQAILIKTENSIQRVRHLVCKSNNNIRCELSPDSFF